MALVIKLEFLYKKKRMPTSRKICYHDFVVDACLYNNFYVRRFTMFFNHLKTVVLLALLNGFVLAVGYHFSGSAGILFALGFALISNLILFYKSDTLVVAMFNAQRLSKAEYPHIYEMVEELTFSAQMPMPKLWLVDQKIANAFATGRNAENSSVAVTTGIIKLLTPDELRAVLAHEISHIRNRDILVSTIAAVMAASISMLADIARWQYYFGYGNRDRREGSSALSMILLIIGAPIIAMILQFAISRTREFMADELGAKLSHSPLELASALRKIESFTKNGFAMDEDESNTKKVFTTLFFANPFKKAGGWLLNLFSSHPPTQERIARLENMKL